MQIEFERAVKNLKSTYNLSKLLHALDFSWTDISDKHLIWTDTSEFMD